jgi:pentapeptide repeat protein
MADETTPGVEPPAEEPKYDQEFFLDLAAKGTDAWNKWRRDPANKDVRVTFAGIDFSEAPRDQINFGGFEFGDRADFSGCKWRGARATGHEAFSPGRARFTGAAFGSLASFDGAAFGHLAIFTGATFSERASFDAATFSERASFARATLGGGASFARATFGEGASFDDATFSERASFARATFGEGASFARATFGERASFARAAFGDAASFKVATFGNDADFQYTTFGDGATFDGAVFGGGAYFYNTVFKGHVGFARKPGDDHFFSISFERARFDGEAVFSGRSFEEIADFTGARFYYPPDFYTATNVARIDFTGAQIRFVRPGHLHWTSKTKIPVRLRAFRKIAEETKNHDLERDRYIEERKAERGVYWRQLSDELKKAPEELKKKLEDLDEQQREVWSNWRHQTWARNAHRLGIAVKIVRLAVHGFWIAVMGVYWALADYGRSVVRPFVCWLVLSLIIFPWLYGQILPVPQKASSLDADKYEQAVQMVARANAVPFVGPLTIDSDIKKFLFCLNDKDCHPIPTECYQWLVIAQNLVSIILVFFIGLALRNYFKIK